MAATRCVINVDLADVFLKPGRKELLRTVAWGDEITVLKQTEARVEVQAQVYEQDAGGTPVPRLTTGYIEPSKSSGIKASQVVRPREENDVLRVNFVDVQQGDGAVIESPDGKVILVDGGDNQLFARYLAARFAGSTAARPKAIECVLVTHGDADHFAGLPLILKSETHGTPKKRLFMQPKRVYHNGIVKRPSKRDNKAVPDTKLLGATKKGQDGRLYLVELVDDLLAVADSEMNAPFKEWKAALAKYHQRAPVEFRRLQYGDPQAFGFFNRGALKIEVLGPLVEPLEGKPALKFLGDPPKGPRVGHESVETSPQGFSGYSASHTINGHSVVFRLSYGGFHYLFCGDLNDEASRFLARKHEAGELDLRAEVFKVPHHGSADFSGAFVKAVAPIVSIVSSGDESARKEYIHPRATLMGALGKWSRVDEPLVFATELAAFFNVEGYARLTDKKKDKARGEFYGFSRTVYGMVKTRTDGKRLLVYTDSGNLQMKEAYAYRLDGAGQPEPARVQRA
jgi:beta-lactamase superfamily II metal-dependent hydrolase